MKLNKLIYPAPHSSYSISTSTLQNKLLFIPRNSVHNQEEEKKSSFSFRSLFSTSSISQKDEEEKIEKTPKKLSKRPPIPCLFLKEKTQGSSKLLIYFHGNAEDIGLSYRDLDLLKKSLKVNILAIEYPGYGVYRDSAGCSADKIKEDCEYVYRYIIQETGISEDDIIIFGRSIGTGPAIHLAAKFKPGVLCLMSAYTSIREIACSKVPFFGNIISTHFENLKHIEKVTCPSIFIHGLIDPLIPHQHSQELHNACPSAMKQILKPENMTHNDFDFHDDIIIPVVKFLSKLRFDSSIQPGKPIIAFKDELFIPPQQASE